MKNKALTPWARFIRLLNFERKLIYSILSYAIFAGLVSLSLPLGIQAIINLIQGGQITTSWYILVLLVILGIAFGGLLQYMQLRISEDLQQRIFVNSSFDFAYRLPKITMNAFYGYYPPELANRFFDTITVQKGVSKVILDFSGSILQILFGLILLSIYHPFFIIFGLLLLFLIFVLFKYTASEGLKTSLTESKYKYRVANWLQEVARSLYSFKVSGKTTLAMEKNDVLVSSYINARENHFRILRLHFIKMIIFKVLVTAGLLIIGGLFVLNQQMNIGQFVAAEIVILLVINSVEKLMLGLENLYDVLTSIEKIGQFSDMELESQEKGKEFDKSDDFVIELKDVGLKYTDSEKYSIRQINFSIHPRNSICITGTSGSGKTTLLKVLAGINKHTEGQFYVNGTSFNNINLNHYRSFLGISISGILPFEGTIKENIAFNNPDVSEEDIRWAIDKTGLGDFVKNSPKGLNTMIYPEGKHLPYSISKKLVLARAIAHKPKLLILKDPLDQLDEIDSEKILDFLYDKTNPWSILVVSRNPKWLNRSETVLEMTDGKLNFTKNA